MTEEKKIPQNLAGKIIQNNNKLNTISGSALATPKQAMLDLRIEKQVQRDGIDMGVLSDGTAFLSGRGLAWLCGVRKSVIDEILVDWNADPQKPRIR